jgi:acyl-[acyl-carrier-protein]-phospholipid O-acyltransferase/long-chain-fatty-acid--[acyl-carrier-protein] ligase
LLKPIVRALLRVLFRVKVEGDASHFSRPRLLIIANHQSFLDGVILGAFLPVDPVFVVHTEVTRRWYFRLALRLCDYLAVDPTNPMAMKRVVRLIESGRPVVIFPEGRITITGSLMKVYDGPAFVAAKTRAVIAPVRLDGAARSYFSRLSGSNPRELFPRITMSIQPPASIQMPEGLSGRMRRRKAGEGMRKIMQEMIFRSNPVQTLYTALIDAMRIYGRGRKMVEDMRQAEYSYNALLKMTLVLGLLVRRISARGETVGILLPNLAATLSMVIGMTAFRRVPAMLNYTAGTDGIQSACVAGRISTVVTSRKFLDTAKLQPQVDALRDINVIYLEDLQPSVNIAVKLWAVLHLIFPKLLGRRVNPESAAVVLFTSGSEGRPKGVVLSHRAILSNIAQIRAITDFSTEDRIFNALPIFHSFGLVAGGLLPILTGIRLFLYPTPLHYRLIPEVIYDRSCTILFGTSTFLNNYARFAHPYDFYRLRYVVAGAEKLAQSVREVWNEKFGIRIYEGYGVTETSPVIAVNSPMATRIGSVGQLLPGMEGKLVPVPGIERGGVLHVRGPNVMLGYVYYENPGVVVPPRSELGPGWHETGDVVEIDDDGFVHILGRVKRFAKIAGEMISLEAVEKIAVAASPGFQHAASSRPDERRGEAIVLFTTDPGLSRDRLQQSARDLGSSEIAVPREVIRIDAIPLLGTGKVNYVKLKEAASGAPTIASGSGQAG